MKPANTLTPDERALRDEHEAAITAKLESFVEVGTRLLDIAEKRLYRETHGSFEPYCREKWGMSARRAYQLCEAAKVVNSLPETVKNFSQTESHAAALASVPEEKREEVIKKAASKGKVTAKSIKEASEPELTEPSTPHITTAEQEVAELKKLDFGDDKKKSSLPKPLLEACDLAIESLKLVTDPDFELDCDSMHIIARDVRHAATELDRYYKTNCGK